MAPLTGRVSKAMGAASLCLLLAAGQVVAQSSVGGQNVALSAVDSVYPTLSKLGTDLDVTITGSGFDASTRVSMYLDSGNSRLIRGEFLTHGFANEVVVAGDKAYLVTSGGKLEIVDISRRSTPVAVGTLVTTYTAVDLAVVKHSAYLATGDVVDGVGEGQLIIVDVSAPANPLAIGDVAIPDRARAVAISGNTAFVAAWEAGLQIIDISDPVNPVIIASVEIIAPATDIKVVNQRAYVAHHGGLDIIDVRNPVAPVTLATIETPGLGLGVDVVGDIVYLAADIMGGLQIIDVSDISNPSILSSELAPGFAYDVEVLNGIAYVADFDTLQIIDVSDPTDPITVGVVDMPGNAIGIAVIGNTAYLAASDAGLQIVDIRTTATPVTIGSILTDGAAFGVKVVGDRAYVTNFVQRFQVVDISDPAEPVIIGGVDTAGRTRKVFIKDNTAYVSEYDAGMEIVDISVPEAPVVLGRFETAGSARGIVVVDTSAYVAAGAGGLQIIDVSNPESPVLISTTETAAPAQDVVVDGSTAYVSTGNQDSGSLTVIDISIPASPVILAVLKSPAFTKSLTVVDGIAFVAAGRSGLIIIDLSTPSDPTLLSTVNTSGFAYEVQIVGNRAYIADFTRGVQVVDISDPANPLVIGSVDTPGLTYGVFVVGDKIYAADGRAGLSIVPTPIEIDSITVVSDKELNLTLPSPQIAGHYSLRLFNETKSVEFPGAVTFSRGLQTFSRSSVLAALDPNALPAPTSESVSKAIILAGGGPYPGNNLWEATKTTANFAYNALLYQGYTREEIYYLSPDLNIDADGDGELNDIDTLATSETLEDSILNWATDPAAPAYELLLFIVDHGGDQQFRLNETTLLSVQELDAWLDELQETMPGKLIVIYDACQSGTFISEMLPPTDKERIVMTSAGDENAYFINEGGLSFSFQFWASVFSGGDLYDSYVFGKTMMLDFQTAEIDSNGNGISQEKEDTTLAQDLIIGRGFIPASDKPFISAISTPQSIVDTTTASISASGIIDATGISRVWGVISHPDFELGSKDTPVVNAPEVELLDPDGDNTWVGSYDHFDLPGTYTITIYAQNNNGFYSSSSEEFSNTTTVLQLTGLADADGDGVEDSIDAFPNDPSESIDTDNDGIGNNADPDDDNDGVSDLADAFPLDPTRSSTSGSGPDTVEAFYSAVTEQLVVPLLDALLQNSEGVEELSQFTNVTLQLATECAGTTFRLVGAEVADEIELEGQNITASSFTGSSQELVIPVLEVIVDNVFGGVYIFRYANVTMSLAPECAGTSLRVTGLTPFQ